MGIPNLGGWNPIGQVGGLLRSLPVRPMMQSAQHFAQDVSSRIPTALNPFATRTPTTRLGQLGKFINPLNPANALDAINPMPGIGAGMRLGAPIAESLGLTGLAAAGPPAILGAATATIGDMVFPRGLAAGTLEEADKGGRINYPSGPRIGEKNTEGRYWAGDNYGYQSPESFNKLFGTRLPTGAVSPPPEPAAPPADLSGSWQQAGQLTPPAQGLAPRLSPGIVSTGAGVPAQRQNVQERALSQEVLNAAQQYAAPASVPLSSFYAGQQQLGRSALKSGDLLNQIQTLGGAAGMTPEALKQWAQQNPGLAYREMLRLKGRNP